MAEIKDEADVVIQDEALDDILDEEGGGSSSSSSSLSVTKTSSSSQSVTKTSSSISETKTSSSSSSSWSSVSITKTSSSISETSSSSSSSSLIVSLTSSSSSLIVSQSSSSVLSSNSSVSISQSSSQSVTKTSSSSSISGSKTSISISQSSVSGSQSQSIAQGYDGVTFGEQKAAPETVLGWEGWKYKESGTDARYTDVWGRLELQSGDEFVSPVVDLGNTDSKTLSVKLNYYSPGYGEPTVHIRGQSTSFDYDDNEVVGPSWELYTAPTSKTWRYVQLKITPV